MDVVAGHLQLEQSNPGCRHRPRPRDHVCDANLPRLDSGASRQNPIAFRRFIAALLFIAESKER